MRLLSRIIRYLHWRMKNISVYSRFLIMIQQVEDSPERLLQTPTLWLVKSVLTRCGNWDWKMLPMGLFTHFECHCYPVGWLRSNKWESPGDNWVTMTFKMGEKSQGWRQVSISSLGRSKAILWSTTQVDLPTVYECLEQRLIPASFVPFLFARNYLGRTVSDSGWSQSSSQGVCQLLCNHYFNMCDIKLIVLFKWCDSADSE